MQATSLETIDEYLIRLDTGSEWRTEIEAFAEEVEIDAGWFSGLGAVQDAEIWFYDQSTKEYEAVVFDEPLEVAACVGNLSWLDGERFAHTHVVCSRPDGTALAGHLNEATVWAGEIHLKKFDTSLTRTHDEQTDLDLWLNE